MKDITIKEVQSSKLLVQRLSELVGAVNVLASKLSEKDEVDVVLEQPSRVELIVEEPEEDIFQEEDSKNKSSKKKK